MNEEEYYEEEDDIVTVLVQCVLPVIAQVTAVFLKLYGLSAIVSLSTLLQNDILTLTLDTVLGVLCSYLFYDVSTLYIVFLVLMSYLTLKMFSHTGKCGVFILLVNLAFVFMCELLLVEAEVWHQIRGTIILLMMKTTSAGFDIDGGVITPPNLLLYLAYCLSPVSLIFGPFVTIPEYRKSKVSSFRLSTFIGVCSSLSLAYITVLISTCLLPDLSQSTEDRFMRAYYVALSFRTSHYFVCYSSHVSALLGGFQDTEIYRVVEPSKVEIPGSMGSVAVAWNLPMHCWLKTYVYKKTRNYGMFVAAFVTYAASSILHGLNFQLPAVLLSIFIFSYVEAMLRKELSVILNSCVMVRDCVQCTHTNKVLEIPIKVMFVVINIVQLAYLGVMFDTDPTQTQGYSWLNTLSSWNALSWYGHVLCLIGAALALSLRALRTS